MADEPVSIVVAESDAGKRLDAALAGLLPGMGLRGRRRACELGRAQVNGRARPAAYRTRPGDVLTLAARQEGGDGAFLSRAVAPVLTPEKAEGWPRCSSPLECTARLWRESPGSAWGICWQGFRGAPVC